MSLEGYHRTLEYTLMCWLPGSYHQRGLKRLLQAKPDFFMSHSLVETLQSLLAVEHAQNAKLELWVQNNLTQLRVGIKRGSGSLIFVHIIWAKNWKIFNQVQTVYSMVLLLPLCLEFRGNNTIRQYIDWIVRINSGDSIMSGTGILEVEMGTGHDNLWASGATYDLY
ncbi:hypothetical protein BDP27DRAFT_1371630 [Rhodocollybia butyracea]|uniref:Uncharacterized protein n=1 Tax=Rhodocollybia butyracea TaxID=206335 RepID=A0A9P5PA04_9AGAR|nr:hypothetical protein BDP27DRAFT_1371630 [Rhodocollybia butyracea]